MAIFEPRTFPEILGEMVSRLVSSTPLTDVNFGSVFTTMLEAAAQEDDEQYFQMLEIIRAFSLDTTTGDDLDDRAEEFGLERLDAQTATTVVTISDTAITKISTGVYSGKAGPAAGTFAINGDSDTGFSTSGSIVIGRSTPNVETVPYTSISIFSNYVTFNLGAGLSFDHGTDETIVLSQGGDRLIASGTTVYVPSSDLNPRIDFTTDDNATIFDGEEIVENVVVTATEAGAASNVPIGSIQEFESLPFSTAIVTNPQRVTNGSDEETDQELRDRIKDTIQSLSRGTPRSIITGVLGIISEEENKRVVSAALIEPTLPADVVKLFIDDGTGFIPIIENFGFEEVVASATGGEKFLFINNVPLVKAHVETQNAEPYNLSGSEDLFVSVGGIVETIVFNGTDFDSPGAATAQEVLTRINASATLYEARISSDGDRVRIFSRFNSDEEIQVTGGTANTELNFPTDLKFTTKLYLERSYEIFLLSKDGRTATIEAGNAITYDMSVITRNLQLVVDGNNENPLNNFFLPSEFATPTAVTAQEICDIIDRQAPGLSCAPSSNDTKFRITSNTERSIDSKIRIIGTYDQVWNEEAAVLIDRTTEAAGAGTLTPFATDLDYLYVGHTDTKFNIIYPLFNSFSSLDIGAVFEVWTGSWTPIGVIDKTVGFTQAGYISFGADPDWIKTSVNGSAQMYFIRIQRNNGGAVTAPVLDKLLISSANEIFGFSQTEVVGTNKDYTLNRFIGQIELEDPLDLNDRMTLGSLDTRAFVVTSVTGNYGLSGGETFDIQVDGGGTQSITFLAGDFAVPGSATPAEVQAVLQAQLNGITATVVDSGLRVRIDTNKMNSGSLEVLSSGTSNAVLQFPEVLRSNLTSHIPAIESGSAEPYSFTASDEIIAIINGNLSNNFTIPCFFGSALTGVTSPSNITDTTLSATFTLAGNLPGYDLEMTSGAQVGNRRTIATYTPGTGVITLTVGLPGAPAPTDTYQILPTSADEVARLWNNKLITTISTQAEIKTSSNGTKVQMASLLPGEEASVLISGGSGNSTLNFPTLIAQLGVDGYRYFTGLAQDVQWTVDGREDDQDNYPGIRAAGVQVEVIEPVIIPISVEIDITTQEGITLIAIQNDIKTAISAYINTLAVGADVIASDVIVSAKSISGVFDAQLLNLQPKLITEENVAIADSELARINEDNIAVG